MSTGEITATLETRKAYLELLKQTKVDLALARQRWVEACLPEIDAAQTIEEAIKNYRAAPAHTEAKARAFSKWVELCTTAKELHKANSTGRGVFLLRFFSDPEREETIHPALRKWMDITLPRVQAAMTLEEIFNILHNEWNQCFDGTIEFHDLVAKKCASFVESEEEAEFIQKKIRYQPSHIAWVYREALRNRFSGIEKEPPFWLRERRSIF